MISPVDAVRAKFPISYAVTAEVKDKRRDKNTRVWLRWSGEGGGWYQWSHTEKGRKLFNTEEQARAAAKSCPGPWFYADAKAKFEIVEVDTMPEDLLGAYEMIKSMEAKPR